MRWEKWREESQWWGFAVVQRDQERPYGEVGEEVRKPATCILEGTGNGKCKTPRCFISPSLPGVL